MWYFSWILGVLLACSFGIINLLWLEARKTLVKDATFLDPVTGLLNKIAFEANLESKIERSRVSKRPFSLLLMRFDSCNKTVGDLDQHEIVQLLMQVTDALKKHIREHADIGARYGEKDFAVILPGVRLNQVTAIAERICDQVATIKESHGLPIAAKIGVAEYPLHFVMPGKPSLTDEVAAIFLAADRALDRAIVSGDERVCCAEN